VIFVIFLVWACLRESRDSGMETRSLFSWFELVRQRAETTGWSCRRKKKGWERREERGPNVYYLIIKGFQQCFPMHWETLLKPNEEG
jgi:hypothetical protein